VPRPSRRSGANFPPSGFNPGDRSCNRPAAPPNPNGRSAILAVRLLVPAPRAATARSAHQAGRPAGSARKPIPRARRSNPPSGRTRGKLRTARPIADARAGLHARRASGTRRRPRRRSRPSGATPRRRERRAVSARMEPKRSTRRPDRPACAASGRGAVSQAPPPRPRGSTPPSVRALPMLRPGAPNPGRRRMSKESRSASPSCSRAPV
jgi:hypothetical protein